MLQRPPAVPATVNGGVSGLLDVVRDEGCSISPLDGAKLPPNPFLIIEHAPIAGKLLRALIYHILTGS